MNIGGVGSDPNITGGNPVPPEQLEKLLADVATWQKTGTVPGDYAPERPVVLEFPADRSIGTTWVDSRRVELQGRVEMPAWATPQLTLLTPPGSFAILEQLKPFKRVTLEIGEMDLQDEDLRSISQLPNLEGLTFKGTSVTKTGLEHLKDATGLKEVSFEKARVPEDAWEALQFCSNLEFLRIPSCQFTGTGLSHLKTLSKLRGLGLSGNRLTDESLEGLKNLPSLKDLNLSDNPITDQGLVHLSGMKNLSMLSLSNTQITDAGLGNLSALTELWNLNLGKTRITDAGLARLPDMHRINYLDLTGTRITDASVEVLKRYPTLQMLTLIETGVTEQGIAELKKFLPHVYFPPPGFKIIKKENPAPTQPANGKGETVTSTTTTTTPVTPGEAAPGKGGAGETGTGNTSPSQKATVASGPLDIRFAGIQVGLGDSMYNQKGEKIGEWLNWPYIYPDRKNLNWRFILDLPETPGPLFTQFNVYRKGKTGAEKGYGFSPRKGYLGGGVASPVESDGKTRRVILNMVFQNGTDDPEKRPDAVDLVFSYFYGPPNEARYRFSGPFEMEKVSEDQGGTLSLRQYLRSVGSTSSYFVFQSKTPIDMNLPVFAFDKRGERRRCDLLSGYYGTSLEENSIAICVSGIPLEELAAVVVGEKPCEFRVEGIPIALPPGAMEETEAQMAEIARALDIEEVDFQKLETYHFGSDPQKALRCLPYLRGVPLRSAWWVVTDSRKPIQLEDLSPELAEQLHQTALKWAQAPVPHHLLGIEMGLWFGWPEFDSMALDLFMRQKTLNYMASGNQESRQINLLDKVLEHFAQKHLGNLVSRIQDALRIAEDPNDFRRLMGSLVNNESLTTTNALLDLAKDERPWIWFRAVQALVERKALPPEDKLTPQEKLRRDAVLAVSFQNERNPQFSPSPEVKSVFLGMLTPEVKRMSLDIPSCFSTALSAVHRYCDRETSTRALVETAQILDPYRWYDGSSIRQITEWINQDYGVNIGKLRTQPYNPSGLSPEQIKQMIAEISTWYRNGAVPGEFRAENPS